MTYYLDEGSEIIQDFKNLRVFGTLLRLAEEGSLEELEGLLSIPSLWINTLRLTVLETFIDFNG